MVRVLFVCLGNICRSPMAEGEVEFSRMHLTCIRAADAAQDVPISRKHRDVRERSPHTEVRAGADSRFARVAKDGW